MDPVQITKNVPVAPSLRFLFRLTSTLAMPTVIGDSGEGRRLVVNLTGGAISSRADSVQGESAFDGATCMEGGADYLTIDGNGLARLNARYVFRLKSGHYMYFQSTGHRFVPPGDEEGARLLGQGEDIDPSRYYFRLKLDLESDDPNPAVREVCNKVVVASAVRGKTSIVYDAYLLE